MKNTCFILFSILALSSIEVKSLNPNASDTIGNDRLRHHIVFLNGSSDTTALSKDSIRSMIDLFYVDQFRHFQDPRAPYFLFMSKDANFSMGIGGVVRLRAWGDFKGSIPANGFVPYLIPVPKDPAQRRRLDATAAGNALFFKVIGRNSKVGNYLAYIECNFDGYNNVGFKLKKAYITINDWTIGYTSTTFSDPMSNPPTIDGAGPNGEVSKSAVMIRWMHTFKKHFTLGYALEIPNSNVSTETGITQPLDDWFPDFTGFGQYEWDSGNQHIRLSKLLRVIPYRNLVTSENKNKICWALQLSSVVKIFRPLTFYCSINAGQGYGSYTNDLSIGNYDLIPNPDKKGELYAPFSVGTTLGLKCDIKPNLYACIALGEMRYLPKYNVSPEEYKYGLYGAANIFWDKTPRFQIGIEYLIGKRQNFNKESSVANRIDALVQFSF